MALFSRRIVVAAASSVAVLASVAGTGATAYAADPITGQAGPTLTDLSGTVKDVVLQWSPVSYATGYEVQLSPDGDFTNNLVTLPNGGKTVNTTYQVPISLPHDEYFWRVRGVDAGGHTPWSSGTHSFTHDWYTPFSAIKTPDTSDPTVSWSPVPEASEYLVQFSTRADFPADSHTKSCITNNTSFTPYAIAETNPEKATNGCFSSKDLTQDQLYYWKVEAFDDSTAPVVAADNANDGGWDCAQAQPECDAYQLGGSFKFHAPVYQPDQVPANVSQAGVTGLTTSWHTTGASSACANNNCPVTPTFSWNAVPGANSYEVHVFHDPYMTNTYRVYDTAWPSVTPRDNYLDAQAGHGFYWYVEAKFCRTSSTQPYCAALPSGATPPQSPVCPAVNSSATTIPTITDTGLTPTETAAGDEHTLTLTGTGFASGACVKSSAGGVISHITVVSPTTMTFDFIAPEQTPSSPLTFTVVNPDGGTSGASPEYTVYGEFQTEGDLAGSTGLAQFTKSSGTVTLSSPVTTGGTTTLRWTPYITHGGQNAYDARNYRVEVASDSSFDNVVWNFANVDMTQFSNPDAVLGDGTYYWRVQPIDESGNGLGWSTASSFALDRTSPTFRLTDASGVAVNGKLHATVSESDIVGTVSQSTLLVVPVVGSGVVKGTWTQTDTTHWTFSPSAPLVLGQRYTLRVVGGLQDQSGNLAKASSASVRTTTMADDKSSAWHASSGWTRHLASGAIGGTYFSAGSGHSDALQVVTSKVSFYGCKGPKFGRLVVQVDGRAMATVNEAQSFTKCGVLLWSASVSSTTVHTVKVATSTGTTTVDAVRIG